MNLHQLFINSAGRLRSGWRLLIFAALFVTIEFLLATAGRLVYAVAVQVAPGRDLSSLFENIVYRSLLLLGALIAGFICTRWLEGLPWRALGLWFHQRWLRDMLFGSAVGIVSLALATCMATIGGGLSFSIASRGVLLKVVQTLLFSAVIFIVAALAEEALFRGYPLQTMTRAGLFIVGTFLTSLAFAGVHLGNPNFKQGLPFLNLILAGVWFAVAYFRTRSLWFPWGLHWAWNWALGSLFGLPVSGITEIAPYPLLHGTDLGPAWLTGGDYGIEGGLACTIALILSTFFIWRTRWIAASDEIWKLTSQENPAQQAQPVPVSN
jgi:membrane protease YdiL (CAAX protease family)